MVLKFDLKKAYNKVEWSFLDKALAPWGFSDKSRRLIDGCVRTVSFSFLINGSLARTSPLIEVSGKGIQSPLSFTSFALNSLLGCSTMRKPVGSYMALRSIEELPP